MAGKRGTISTIVLKLSVLAYTASMVSALVVGIYNSCHTVMYTWLLVYGLTTAILIIIGIVLPPIEEIKEENMNKARIICLQCSIIFINIIQVFINIFLFSWIIYGAVLFFPAASSGPFPTCTDGQEGKVIVITGTVLVVLHCVIWLCCGAVVFLIARNKEETGKTEEATPEMAAVYIQRSNSQFW